MGCVVCTNVTVCFSSLLSSDSILKACERLATTRAARGRIDAVSGSGVDVITSLVGDEDPAVTVSFYSLKNNHAFSKASMKIYFNYNNIPIP